MRGQDVLPSYATFSFGNLSLLTKYKTANGYEKCVLVELVAKFPAKDKNSYVRNTWQFHSALHLKNVKPRRDEVCLAAGRKRRNLASQVAKPVRLKNTVLLFHTSHCTRFGEIRKQHQVKSTKYFGFGVENAPLTVCN